MSSLRHQLSLAKEKAGKESQETNLEVVHLQTDIGIMKKKLAEKVRKVEVYHASLLFFYTLMCLVLVHLWCIRMKGLSTDLLCILNHNWH